MSQLLSFTIAGIVTGSVYAVGATGLVVTYATSGIFNIAHGAIGMLMAFTYWELRVNQDWPAPLALIVVVAVLAPVFGALIERTLMRTLRGSSVATSLVVTLGLMVGLIGVAQTLWDPTEARDLPGFFAPGGLQLGRVFVTWHEVITVFAGGAVALFLWLFLSRTRVGIAMRAVVDDRNLLGLAGARPDRVSQLSWAIGSCLAAVAGILLAPVLSLNVLVLTLLVVNAYAAAMVGRLRSLPLTFAGAMALGLVEAYVVGYVHLEGWLLGLRPALPTLFLFIALLAVPEARLRAGRLVRSVTPRVPTVRASILGAVALIAVAAFAAATLERADLVRVGQGLAFGLVMLSLVPLVGYGGQVSICQMTFAGLGAFAMARLGGDGSIVGIVAAAALAAAVGGVVALPALRLQGLYLALSTMAFAVLMDSMVFPNTSVFGNLGSLPVGRLDLLGLSFDGERAYFVLLATAFAAFGLLVVWIRRGRFGRMLSAMRDSQVACATLGLSLARTKLTVFMLSAGMAGVAGALYGGLRGSAGPTDFQMFQSLPILLLAVVGGITSVSGALAGGLAYALLPVVQSRVPAIGGFIFLVTGVTAVAVGRNPNGIAFLIAQRLRALRPPPPPPELEPVLAREVTSVAAPTG